jgi:hypothetical protein
MLFSCSGTPHQNKEAEFDYSQFDYLKRLYFNKTWKECEGLLPNPKKLVADKDEGFGYDFGTQNVNHNATFLFYGANFFSEAIIEIDFLKNIEPIERSFMYITKLLENEHGKASFHNQYTDYETITWNKETTDNKLFVISLTKKENLISINYSLQPNSELEKMENQFNKDSTNERVNVFGSNQWDEFRFAIVNNDSNFDLLKHYSPKRVPSSIAEQLLYDEYTKNILKQTPYDALEDAIFDGISAKAFYVLVASSDITIGTIYYFQETSYGIQLIGTFPY